MVRRFRVELFESKRGGRSAAPAPTPVSQHVDSILVELNDLRQKVNQPGNNAVSQSIESTIAVWSGVEDIQRRLEVTKSEISALKSKGVVREGETSRTTEELRAVITGTEEATDAILASAETIDDIAQKLASSSDPDVRREGNTIAEAVIQIFEACNFQDISGQRITKVVESLHFVEERIASMVDVWQTMTQAQKEAMMGSAEPAPEPDENDDKRLLNGPSLKTDANVVSQDDVDALFP